MSAKTRLIIVTGLSGAGKSSALKIFEDLGYEVVDNLPPSLVSRLLTTVDDRLDRQNARPLAIGVDSRTRAFSQHQAEQQIARIRKMKDVESHLIFFDCADDILARRFSETRRRHPLALDRPIADGIAREREELVAVRDLADALIDTSDLSVHDLRAKLEESFTPERPISLMISVQSFGFAKGLPRDADLVFDVRFLRNPHYKDDLRPLTGRDEAVASYVRTDPDFEEIYGRIRDLVEHLLPRYKAEGKSYFTIAIGCTGGRHRSVFVVEKLARDLIHADYDVKITHRDTKFE